MNLELKESDETKEDKDYYFMDTACIGELFQSEKFCSLITQLCTLCLRQFP